MTPSEVRFMVSTSSDLGTLDYSRAPTISSRGHDEKMKTVIKWMKFFWMGCLGSGLHA